MKIPFKTYASTIIFTSILAGCATNIDHNTPTPSASNPAPKQKSIISSDSKQAVTATPSASKNDTACKDMTPAEIQSTQLYIRNQLFNVLETSSLEFGINVGLKLSPLPTNVTNCVKPKVHDLLVNNFDNHIENAIEKQLYCPVFQSIQGKEIEAFNTLMKENPAFQNARSQAISSSFAELAVDRTLSSYKDVTLSTEQKTLGFIPSSQKVISPIQKAMTIITYNRLEKDNKLQSTLQGINKMISDSGCDISCMNKRISKIKAPLQETMANIAHKIAGPLRSELAPIIANCEKTAAKATPKAKAPEKKVKPSK